MIRLLYCSEKLSARRYDATLRLVIHLKSVLTLGSQRLNVYECLTGSNVLQRFACSLKRLSIYEVYVRAFLHFKTGSRVSMLIRERERERSVTALRFLDFAELADFFFSRARLPR